MEPIRPYEIFYKVFQPVNRQIFEHITQRMLLALKCYKRNVWTVRETHEQTEKIIVQKIYITVQSQGAVNTPMIQFQTVYSSERDTVKCEMETKNVFGVPDGKCEVFYIANTDEFMYARDPKVSDYMNIIFAPLFVDILYKDIEIIVATLRWHHDAYEHTKEVQKRKMEHRETDDDKCDAAWQQELLHLSETLRQMNTEHTGIRYETILFHRGKHAPPALFAYVVQMPYDVLRGVIVIAANLNDDTALELRYYQTSSGLLSNDDKTTVMSITHAGVVCSGYDDAYQKLCAAVGKDHGDKIVGMVQETTGDPIKQKEEVMVDKNKWVSKMENIHNKIQQFKTERFSIESNFIQSGDEFAQITVYLHDKADDAGEPFGEIRYTANEKHDSIGAKWDAGLTIRYFSNRQDVQWCEPLSIVDANTGKYIAREEPSVMLKDLGSRWTDKFIGLLRAEASDEPIEETDKKKEEGIVSERTHTIELKHVIIGKAVLPEGCDEHHYIALKIFSVDADVHNQIFKMYEDCPLENPIDAKERYAPSRDGDTTTVVIFVPDANEIDMEKVWDYYSTITLTLDSIFVPCRARLNAEVTHIKVPSIGEWDGLPKKKHEEKKCESDEEPVKPAEDKWVRFIEDMEKMFNRQNDKSRFKHMKFETKHKYWDPQHSRVELDVICFINDSRAGLFTIGMNNKPNNHEERVPVVIRFWPESEGYCEGIYWIDDCKHHALHVNKQTGGHRPFYTDMVRTVGIKFVQFFEQWLKNKLEYINADCEEEEIEDVDEDTTDCDKPKVESTPFAPQKFTLRDVAINVIPHSACKHPPFIEFAPISELEKMRILDMYSGNPVNGEEAKRIRIVPQFWQIRGTNTFRVRLCVFISSSDMLHRLEAARPYERFDVKLLMAKGQINIEVESLTFKKMLRGSTELFEIPTEAKSIEKGVQRVAANSTYGMMGRSFDECVEEAVQLAQAFYPESDTAKKLSANPGETIWIDSFGCNNKTKNSGGTTMRGTSISIEKLFFSGTTTIVIWTDGTKTVVQPTKGERFDPEIGIAMAIARKIFGSRHQFDKFTENVFRESYARDAKSLTEKELAMLLPEYEKIIASAKAKHEAVHQAYEKAVSEGSKKLPKLYGLKSDPDYRYATIRASIIKAELESRKAKKAVRAACAKKPTTAKKPSTRKKSTK